MSQSGYIASRQAALNAKQYGFELRRGKFRRTPGQVKVDNARLIVGIFMREEQIPRGFRTKTGATPVNWREESVRRRYG
jgi:hypothetical protein